MLNITLIKDGVETQPDNKITVTINLPEGVDGTKAKIFRCEEDGTVTDMNAIYDAENNTLTFETKYILLLKVPL